MAQQVFTLSTSNSFMVRDITFFPDLTKIILAAIFTIYLHEGTINQHKPDHRPF